MEGGVINATKKLKELLSMRNLTSTLDKCTHSPSSPVSAAQHSLTGHTEPPSSSARHMEGVTPAELCTCPFCHPFSIFPIPLPLFSSPVTFSLLRASALLSCGRSFLSPHARRSGQGYAGRRDHKTALCYNTCRGTRDTSLDA